MPLIAAKCTQCGANLKNDEASCEYCGTPFLKEQAKTESTKFCKFCGDKIHSEAVVCPKCGRQVEVITGQQVISGGRKKYKLAALLLCILFGFFGAHKFYEGKNTMGIIYVFTFGLFFIGWVVDIIILAYKPNIYYVP